jgi:hypothetical protein
MRTIHSITCAGIACASLLTALVGCGNSTPPPEVPETAAATASGPREARKAPQVMQELGSIDPREIDTIFRGLSAGMMACQEAGIKRVEYLAGDVKFFIRISHEGRAKYVVIEESTLGDHETEDCMRGHLMRANWPKPLGGDEAEARKGLGFDIFEARPPAVWGPDKVASVVAKHERELRACVGDAKGAFKVTAYIAPAGKDGKVEAAGLATSTKEGDAKRNCILDAVQKMKFPSPGSYAAKTTFGI